MKKEFRNIIESLNSEDAEKIDSGFSVPEGYFDQLSVSVAEELGIDEVDNDLPADYFATLENRVMDTVKQDKRRIVNLPFRSWSAAAAILILGVVSFSLWMPNNNEEISHLQFVDDLDDEELDYLMSEEDFSLEDVLDDTYDEEILESIEIDEYAIEADDPFLEELIEDLTDSELEELLL